MLSNFSLSSLELEVYLIILSSSLTTFSKMLMFLTILVSLPLRDTLFFLGESCADLTLGGPPLEDGIGVGTVCFLREGLVGYTSVCA